MGHVAQFSAGAFVVLGMLAIGSRGVIAQQSGGGQASARSAGAELSAMVDRLAQTVFANADDNHNRLLNKTEFENAQQALLAEIEQWGRQGLIGLPQKSTGKDKANVAPASAAEAAAKLAKSKRISQPEFTLYAHAVVEEADQYFRQINAMTAAQRKAYNAQRNFYRSHRVRTGYPYQYPYPY